MVFCIFVSVLRSVVMDPISIGLGVGSLAAGFFGQRDADKRSASSARQAMEFESKEAQINRDFQERMSSSAYQRAVADLKLANLNPMLAFGHPASTPGGSAASGKVSEFHDALGKGVSSARDSIRLKKELMAVDSTIAMNAATAEAQRAKAAHDTVSARMLAAGLPAAEEHGRIDAKMAGWDAAGRRVGSVADRVLRALGVGVSAKAVRKFSSARVRFGDNRRR